MNTHAVQKPGDATASGGFAWVPRHLQTFVRGSAPGPRSGLPSLRPLPKFEPLAPKIQHRPWRQGPYTHQQIVYKLGVQTKGHGTRGHRQKATRQKATETKGHGTKGHRTQRQDATELSRCARTTTSGFKNSGTNCTLCFICASNSM